MASVPRRRGGATTWARSTWRWTPDGVTRAVEVLMSGSGTAKQRVLLSFPLTINPGEVLAFELADVADRDLDAPTSLAMIANVVNGKRLTVPSSAIKRTGEGTCEFVWAPHEELTGDAASAPLEISRLTFERTTTGDDAGQAIRFTLVNAAVSDQAGR